MRISSASLPAHVAEDDGDAARAAVGMVGQVGMHLDRMRAAVACHADGLAAEGDVGLALAHDVDRVASRQLGRHGFAHEDFPHRAVHAFGGRPAGDALGHRVHARDAARLCSASRQWPSALWRRSISFCSASLATRISAMDGTASSCGINRQATMAVNSSIASHAPTKGGAMTGDFDPAGGGG
jgi:hypothetical protein